jgi:hypothetical protein
VRTIAEVAICKKFNGVPGARVCRGALLCVPLLAWLQVRKRAASQTRLLSDYSERPRGATSLARLISSGEGRTEP